jgi:hypothetical protein
MLVVRVMSRMARVLGPNDAATLGGLLVAVTSMASM